MNCKKTFLILTALFCFLAYGESKIEKKFNLRLCIFGDIQPQTLEAVRPDNVDKLLKKGTPLYYVRQVYKLANKLGTDGYLIAGDVANYNEPGMYDLFRKLYEESIEGMKNPPLWLPVMGNHDFWGTFWIKSSHDPYGKLPETRAKRTEIFCKHLKIKSANHHVVVNGYDIIGYSIEGGMFFKPEAVKEVEAMIQKAVARDANKPIILFAHNHTGHTVRESGSNHLFYKMLSKYPQVIYFSGHTHIPLEDEMTIHQKDFTSVGTGALLNAEAGNRSYYLPHGDRYLGKTMLYMTIDDKEVAIHRYQLRDGSEILDNGNVWKLPLPLEKKNFTYTIEKRFKAPPVFPEKAKLETKLLYGKKGAFEGVRISGPAAKHPNGVYCYEIEIFEKQNGKWIFRNPVYRGKSVKRKLLLPGDYYKGRNFQQKTFTGDIFSKPGNYLGFFFEPGKTYRIDLRAKDFFETYSAETLSNTVSIPAKSQKK